MEKPFKFLLPSPNFDAKAKESKPKPHFLTPSGMTLLPREKQPPPMYGKRGATVPSRFLQPSPSTVCVPDAVKQYCEPCEMELASVDDLKHHRAQHERCPVEGCQYRGHPSVMDKHVTALHSSGLFEKFKKLNSPEEIAAWREERRKRYPTVQNVLLKQKAMEQKQKRGERLEANKSRFGKQDDRKRALPNNECKNNGDAKNTIDSNAKSKTQNRRNKNKRKRNDQNRCDKGTKIKTLAEKSEESENDEDVDLLFKGTLQMKGYKHFNRKTKILANALSGILGMYGSDDDYETDEDSDNGKDDNELFDTSKDTSKPKQTSRDLVEIDNIQNIPINIQEEDSSKANDECVPKDTLIGDKDSQLSPAKSITDDNSLVSLAEISKDTIIGVKDSQLSPAKSITDDKSLVSSVEISKVEHYELSKDVEKHMTARDDHNFSDDGPEEKPIERNIPAYKIMKDQQPVKPSELCPKETIQKCEKTSEAGRKPKQNVIKRKSGLDYRKAKVRKQNTMLEKLLEADIRHERNVLLQCVRYVCENNFFGVEKPTPSTLATLE